MPGRNGVHLTSAKRLLLGAPSWPAFQRFPYFGERIDPGGSGPVN